MTHKDPAKEEAYSDLLKICLSLGPERDEKKLATIKSGCSRLGQEFREKVVAFQEQIARTPLSAILILWAEECKRPQDLRLMCELLQAQLLELPALANFSELRLSSLLDSIRCYQSWTFQKREEAVALCCQFISWLSEFTLGYIQKVEDTDRLATERRQVSFETYIELLSRLDLRERILAKIFYLGGARALEEVLSLQVEDIDFTKSVLRFSEMIQFPSHLFVDLREYLNDRTTGYLFLGKDGEKISHTTPFRALKKVLSEVNLDPEFTFKDLTRNI